MTPFIENLESWLVTVNKDNLWLLSATGYTPVAWNNWRNGFKNPSLDAINAIALALKNAGANIWTPKQIMPEGMKFTTRDSHARTNIAWLAKLHNISMPEFYSGNFGLAKNSVVNVITHDKQPNYANLEKFANAFKKMGKGSIQSPVDLVYFPLPWGETEKTYLEIRNKVKIIP